MKIVKEKMECWLVLVFWNAWVVLVVGSDIDVKDEKCMYHICALEPKTT